MAKKNVSTGYPVKLVIDYPGRQLNRLTSVFRIFLAIPVLIVISLISGPNANWGEHAKNAAFGWGGILFLPTLLLLLFRAKYPKWWFDWNAGLTRFSLRVVSYLALLTDTYPSTDEEQSVHVTIAYPNASKDLNRWMPLVKWFLAIPHYFILVFLFVGAIFAVIFAWFAILFTGKYPRGLFDYVTGVMRWALRVSGYAFLLLTDIYPPFSLK